MNKIIFSDNTEFTTAAYPIETEPPIFAKQIMADGISRDYIRITVASTYAEVASKFISGATFFIRQYDINENGIELDTYNDFDWSEYSIAGDIVDHRDGRITVYMSKPTAYESAIDDIMIDTILSNELN